MGVRAAASFIWPGDEVPATCQVVVTCDWSTTRYFLPDHLNSTNVITDASGTPIQTLDYYPYGSTRISQTTGGFNEQKQYIGQYSDPESSLSYLQARYYDSSKGEFLSEDPTFLGDPAQQTLSDPQSLNSYSYANDNPIRLSDPSGKDAALVAPLAVAVGAILVVASFLPQNQQKQISAGLANLVRALASVALAPSRGTSMPTVTTTGAKPGLRPTPLAPQSGTMTIQVTQDSSVPWSSINLAQGGDIGGTPKPNDAPSGTRPIDKVGLSKDAVHQIKDIIGAGAKDWVGKAPNGDIITGTPDRKTINHGPIDPYDH